MERDSELLKSYAYLGAVILVLGVFYFITQNPSITPKEKPDDKLDVEVEFLNEGEVWQEDFHLVSMPYDCRNLYTNTTDGIRVKNKDVVSSSTPEEGIFQIKNIGDGGHYRVCSYTDYFGIVESYDFKVNRTNETAEIVGEERLKFKEYYLGSIRQTRNLELILTDTKVN